MDDQRPLQVELFHNQDGYLLDPPAEYFELFNSLNVGLNDFQITHALKINPVICASGVGSIEAEVQKKEIITTEPIVQEVLKFGDYPNHPTSYEQDRVVQALHRMSYEEAYPTVLKKLFPPYWRLLVHIFL
ncbi:hypothetical protein Hanom_Chr08g00747161 [Helianthus anomalus]